MGLFGSLLGKIGGGLLGGALGGERGKEIGGAIGGIGGKFLPFKKGGRVPQTPTGTQPALLHSGEYVLPANVKPTKAQMKAVNKGKKKK